ncbi:MAG: ATP-binding protein [Janthinobacterium lividum]
MKTSFQIRLVAVLLAILTLTAVGLAIGNLLQEIGHETPTDGVLWMEAGGGLRATVVPADTPAGRAGIHPGDLLTAINDTATPRLAAADRAMDLSGIWSHASYSILRSTGMAGHPAALEVGLILEPADRTDHQLLRLIALVYLAIGLYVLFRRWTALQSTHFFVFCLTSFVLYAFKFTGKLDTLDSIIYTGEILATALQPALFLHFALSFSGQVNHSRWRRLLYGLLYLPGAGLVYLRYLSFARWVATGVLQHRLDQLEFIYLAVFYVLAAAVFLVRYRRETQPLERQQLKWLSRGTLLTVTPFTALYIIPFLADLNVPAALSKIALLSLLLLPLTFSWAIVRYRLMDVDLIFKRGVAYTLATAALVGVYFGVIAVSAELIHNRFASLRIWGLMIAVIVTGLIFDPLKRMIQARLDRLFDQKRVDYRETLIEFGRRLNAQTELDALVGSVVDRLQGTLLVTRVAVFLADEGYSVRRPRYTLVASHGLSPALADTPLDLGFLAFGPDNDTSHMFFEAPQSVLRLPESQRAAAAALDLNYFVPCRAARHEGGGQSIVAVLGLGRTGDGDFLSSEDMELLESLAGYIGIAIQNAQLYRRLEQKILDFERLRDFNENIVESINVGVFALDPEDRIESWNTQMETMHGTARSEAMRRPARAIFSSEFADELDRLRSEQGVHTLYKFRLPLPDGEVRTANVTVAPLLNRELETLGRIVIVDDVSDQVSMEAQLTQAEKLSSIGLLAAGVAHEVNTPLAVISSYTQMLGKQLRLDETAQAKLGPVIEKITQQTFRASEIVNGLLNFSRMSTVDFGRVDLNQIVRETVLLLEHQMRSSGVPVIMELDGTQPVITGNRGKLQQVLVNLMLNARDALLDRHQPAITVSTRHTGEQIEMQVADTGAGMPREVLRKIYDPFFTTKSQSRDGRRKGTGLGLAVSYGIVQEHGGTIEATSEVDQGTVFRLLFPALDPPVAAGLRAVPITAGLAAGPAEEQETVVHA